MKKFSLLFVVLVMGLSSVSFAGGTIVGVAKFVGENPNYPAAVINKDQEVCGAAEKPSEKLVLSAENGILNVFVSVVGVEGEKLAVPAENPTFPQAQCQFTKHIMVVPTGSTVEFPNKSDKVMHNLHSYSRKNRPFNKGVPFGGVISSTFSKPETIKITCDVHKWMTAYLIVHDDPYYCLTDENGNYKIENVPAGTYKIVAWQEALGKQGTKKQPIEVVVVDGQETTMNFDFKPRKSRKKKSS